MSEERRRRAEAARVGAEAGRQSAEADREGAERDDADSRQRAEKEREDAEGRRNQAESRRRVADVLPLLPRSRWAAMLVFLCLLLAGSIPAVATTYFISRHEADRARADAEQVTRHVFTQVCLRNNQTKASIIVGEQLRVRLVKKVAPSSEAVAVAEHGLVRAAVLNVLLDCERTFENDGAGVPLSPRVSDRYLRLVGGGWVPELRGDLLVGRHRAEAEGHKDF